MILVMEAGLSGLLSPFEEDGEEGQIQQSFFQLNTVTSVHSRLRSYNLGLGLSGQKQC